MVVTCVELCFSLRIVINLFKCRFCNIYSEVAAHFVIDFNHSFSRSYRNRMTKLKFRIFILVVNNTTFKVWAPTAIKVILNLFTKGNDVEAYKTVEMTKGEKGVWSHTEECGHGTFPQRVSVLRGRAAERLRGVPESQTGCYFSAKARCSRPTVFAQGTLLSAMWQLGREGSLEESGYLYMHDQVPLLST